LACMGKTVIRVGDSGAGQITKACNQLLLLVTAQGAAEALALAQRCGVDPVTVREVMMAGIASSRVLDVFGQRMVERNFANGIDTRLYHKDLDIALGLAHDLGAAAPAASVTMQHINAAIGRGEGASDLSVLIEVLEGMSRVKL
jgi:2-hydroxy-3-oxopropionate reductase